MKKLMIKLRYIIILCLSTIAINAQDFYDMNVLQKIEIVFTENNWDALLDAEKAGDENYIMAKSVTINGTSFDSVGVKYKGNSTYRATQVKNPFHIELDTYKDQNYLGYKDIKLSNAAKDPSFLREVLSYEILRQYMDAPQSNYANVYVNGDLIGLYSNSEAVTKRFLKSHFLSSDNSFFKCNPIAGAGPQSSAKPNLVYLGEDSISYNKAYELKSDLGWNDLIELCKTLDNNIDNITHILDVDKVLWVLAFNNVLVNLDSYIGVFAQNYYLYKLDNGQFAPVVWDLNESFGRFANTGSGNLTNTLSKQQMSHLLHENDASFPLLEKLLEIPQYKRMYLAHYKTILIENFDNDTYTTIGLNLQELIDESVASDDNKFYTYNNFLDNFTSDVSGGGGPGGGSTPGITSLMDGRSDYLLNSTDFINTEPIIADIGLSNGTPIIGETVNFSSDVKHATNVYLNYRFDTKDPFTRIEMYDNGLHNDGASNDDIFAVDLAIDHSYVQYYMYAENNNIGKFSPQRAAHDYYSLTATITETEVGDIVINEFMASNDASQPDQDGEYDDWIELYNNSGTDIDLSAYYLSDNAEELDKWSFPSGTIIEVNSYLIIWADKDEEQSGLHANFKLSAAAESIFIVDETLAIIDEISYTDQTADISYGRFPNGIGDFQVMNPTFNAENMAANSTSVLPEISETFIVTPNPVDQSFNIEMKSEQQFKNQVQVYKMNGQLVFDKELTNIDKIDCSLWLPGVYIVSVDGSFLKLVIF